MNLAIFDVDGTLLDNLEAEDDCFLAALRTGLGLHECSREWASYRYVSDQGIACEAYERQFGTTPTSDAINRTIDQLLQHLANAHAATPLRAICGSAEMLAALPERGWCVALATGAWQRAAEFKLAAAGLPIAGLPKATADDGPQRADIVRTAMTRAARRYGGAFERVVTIGDGIWDVETARVLALPFLGIGAGTRAERLRAAGAQTILRDYTEIESVLRALEVAQRPLDIAP